jgi:hypothetical protein
MKKIQLGFILGIAAGILDLIPMFVQNLTWDANLSAFSLWVVSGILIAASNIKLNSSLKGILTSFLVLLPSAILISWKEPFSLVPITIMTLILGALLGFFVEKYGR